GDLDRITGFLETEGILRLTESEIAGIGHLSWQTYLAARALAERESAGARCYVHDLRGDGTLGRAAMDPVLLGETVKSDEPALIRELGALPVIHLSTRDNRILPVFLSWKEHTSHIINDLNTLCVKIIRNKEITALERDHLIIKKVRFDPHKARELGVPSGPFYKDLSSGKPVVIDGREITPAMVSSSSEIRIHIPGLENFP
ncbi:MAG TPA: D-tyrosyl-tRNA(Tyr) deacylase, partial [Methanoregula sp.]|nr:D-tyrosyl-tRNA(Tyr) deacylase [Methanoregula sp.]